MQVDEPPMHEYQSCKKKNENVRSQPQCLKYFPEMPYETKMSTGQTSFTVTHVTTTSDITIDFHPFVCHPFHTKTGCHSRKCPAAQGLQQRHFWPQNHVPLTAAPFLQRSMTSSLLHPDKQVSVADSPLYPGVRLLGRSSLQLRKCCRHICA